MRDHALHPPAGPPQPASSDGPRSVSGSDAGEHAALSTTGFQDQMESLIAWLAEENPELAARFIGDYLDDLATELDHARGP
jgi:hypothetical protein